MLNITGLNDFFYLRNFHDMPCKYDRVLSIIRSRLYRGPMEGEVIIMMSKDHRKVRLFEYASRSFSMHEKRFKPGNRFMQVEHLRDQEIFTILRVDVLPLLESPVIKTLRIK